MESKEKKQERWRLLVEQFRYWLRKYDNQLSTPIENTQVTQTITPSTSPMVLAFPSGLELKFTCSGLTEDLGALTAQLHRAV